MTNRLLFYLLAIFCLIGPMAAQEPFNVEEVLPSTTLACATVTDVKAWHEELKTTGVYQLVQSKEFQGFLDTLAPEIKEKIEKRKATIEKILEMPLENLQRLFVESGQVSLALVDAVLVDHLPFPMPIVLVSWDLREKKEEFSIFFEKSRQKLYQKLPVKIEETQYVFQESQVTIVNTPMPIYLTYVGNVLLICSEKNYLERVISETKNKPENSLASFELYKNVKKQLLKEKAGKFLYFNLKGIRELGMRLAGPNAQQIQPMLQMSGLDSLDAVGMGVRVQNKQVVESLYISSPNGRTGILGSFVPPAQAEQNLIKSMPNKVVAFSHGYFNLGQLYDSTMEMAQKFAPPTEYENIQKTIQAIEEKIGLQVKEMIGWIGNEYLLTVSCSGGFIPDFAFQLTLKEGKKIEEHLQKFLALVPPKHCFKVKHEEGEFTYFNFSSKREPIPVAPSLMIKDDRLIFALFPETLKNIVAQKEGKLPEDFQNCVGETKYIYGEYLNLKAIVAPLYRTLLPMVQSMVPRHKVPFELALLPGGDLVENYLTNLMFVATQSNEGILWEIHSPAGTIPLLIASGGIAYAAERKFKRRMPPRFEKEEREENPENFEK